MVSACSITQEMLTSTFIRIFIHKGFDCEARLGLATSCGCPCFPLTFCKVVLQPSPVEEGLIHDRHTRGSSIVFGGTHTIRMTQVNFTLITVSGLMGLHLKHPDAIAQLLGH
jgi:hypothetical protein